MSRPIEIPAILSGFSSLVAGGLSLRFSTQELTPEEELIILQHKGQAGYLLFKPDSFSEDEIPTEDTETGFKTPSQRLRGVLYKLHMESDGTPESFSVFYNKKMEQIISHYKSQLDKIKEE